MDFLLDPAGQGIGKLFASIAIGLVINSCAMWFVMNHMMGRDNEKTPFMKCVTCCLLLVGVQVLAVLALLYSPFLNVMCFWLILSSGSIAVVQGTFEMTEGGGGILTCYFLVTIFIQAVMSKVDAEKEEAEFVAYYDSAEYQLEEDHYKYSSYAYEILTYFAEEDSLEVGDDRDWSRAIFHREADGHEIVVDLPTFYEEGKTPRQAARAIEALLENPDAAALPAEVADGDPLNPLLGVPPPASGPSGEATDSEGIGGEGVAVQPFAPAAPLSPEAAPIAAPSTTPASDTAAPVATPAAVAVATPVPPLSLINPTPTPVAPEATVAAPAIGGPTTGAPPATAPGVAAPAVTAPAVTAPAVGAPAVAAAGTAAAPVTTTVAPPATATPASPAPIVGIAPVRTPTPAELAPADLLMQEAGKAWNAGQHQRSIANAQSALAIYRRLLGDNSPRVLEVQKMIESAKQSLPAESK